MGVSLLISLRYYASIKSTEGGIGGAKMYEKILVPLDGSELGEVALPYVEELASKLKAEVTLLQVVAPGFHFYGSDEGVVQVPYTEEEMAPLKASAEGYLEKVGSGLKDKGVNIRSEIRAGTPDEEIVDYAEKGDIGLMVMATHGHSGIGRWALGSVADKVVRATTRPVALIRAKDGRPDVREKDMLDKVLVPLDGSKEGETVIPYIKELASKVKAEVTLLYVMAQAYHLYTSENGAVQVPYRQEEMEPLKASAAGYLEKMASGLKDKGITAIAEIRVGSAAEEIIKLADETRADLVAMSTHGRSGISRWAFGSVADKVLHAGNTPLLLVRVPGSREG